MADLVAADEPRARVADAHGITIDEVDGGPSARQQAVGTSLTRSFTAASTRR